MGVNEEAQALRMARDAAEAKKKNHTHTDTHKYKALRLARDAAEAQ